MSGMRLMGRTYCSLFGHTWDVTAHLHKTCSRCGAREVYAYRRHQNKGERIRRMMQIMKNQHDDVLVDPQTADILKLSVARAVTKARAAQAKDPYDVAPEKGSLNVRYVDED